MPSVLWSAGRLHRCIMELRDGKFVAFWFVCLYSWFFDIVSFIFLFVFFSWLVVGGFDSCFILSSLGFHGPIRRARIFFQMGWWTNHHRGFGWTFADTVCLILALSTGTRFLSTVYYPCRKSFFLYGYLRWRERFRVHISEAWCKGSAGLGIWIHNQVNLGFH